MKLSAVEDEDAVATGTGDRKLKNSEPHAKTLDTKLKKVKFAVEAMEIEPYDAKIKNVPKDAKFANVKNES